MSDESAAANTEAADWKKRLVDECVRSRAKDAQILKIWKVKLSAANASIAELEAWNSKLLAEGFHFTMQKTTADLRIAELERKCFAASTAAGNERMENRKLQDRIAELELRLDTFTSSLQAQANEERIAELTRALGNGNWVIYMEKQCECGNKYTERWAADPEKLDLALQNGSDVRFEILLTVSEYREAALSSPAAPAKEGK